MSSSEDRNSAAGKSERRWSSDPLRVSKRRSGSKRRFRPKTTYIDSTSFDLQALDAGTSNVDVEKTDPDSISEKQLVEFTREGPSSLPSRKRTSSASSSEESSQRFSNSSPVSLPSDIQARGPEATEAYKNALMDGKAFLKRVPIMIIGQARTGKTSLKKSLKGEKFDPKEQITEGIETDPSYFKVSTEVWRAGENKNNKTDPESEDFFEQNIAQSIFGALKNVKISPSPPLRKPGNDSSDTPNQTNSHSFEEEIPESIATRVEKLLQNNENVEQEEEIFSILWDFGGQSVYYATHPIFLTEKAIYILACDLSRNPYDKADTLVRKGLYRNKEDICNKTNLDYLDFWLSSVYSLVGPDAIGQDTSPSDASTARLPPVFFVCTHADEPYCSATDPRDLAVDIFGFLRSKPYKSHLFKDVFVVDNTKSGSRNGCPEVTRLRQKLLSVAQGLPQLKEAIPLKWLKFENILRLLREDNCKLMAIGEARQIATDKCGIDHDGQFRTMLDFLHDQKVLIHFNETQLNNLVILDPQWLIDIFKKVITIRRYEYTEDNVERFWLKLQETGILDERLLDHEWKHLIDKYSKETCGSLIAIMERFSLLCPWPSDGENIQYLVPSMLMSPPTNDVLELLASVRTPSLFVRFEVGRVPPGLFTRLVLQFYQWCHEEWKSQKQPELFRNFAQFHILPDEGTSAIIMCHSSSIEIIIHDGSSTSEAILTNVTGYKPGLTTSRKIHWQLRLILECMRREFSWLKNMKYEMCICCPVCSQKGSPKCRSHDVRGCECLHLLSESELLQCQYCTQPGLRGDCRIYIKMFAPWFSFSGPKESRTPVNQRSVYGCSDVGERISETFREEKSLALRHDVLQCIQTQSSDPKEIVVQFQECLQLTPTDLKNPEPQTQRWIRYLANEAKSQNRSEIIEYLRTIVPAGTTGPLLDENLDVRCIPFKIRKELTVELSGGDEWKQLAESFGMSYNEIRLLDKRTFIPCDVVLDLIANHRYLIVGELYDRLVKSGLPGSADLL